VTASETRAIATPFASLPMYDWPEVSAHWDKLWALAHAELAARRIEAGEALLRTGDHEAHWADPELLLGQTCGWPFVSHLSARVVPFARFDFGFTKAPGDYHSVFIASGDGDPRDLLQDRSAIIAINGFDSQSGFRALSNLADAPVTLPALRFTITGGHRNSIRAVAKGEAQLSAIDAQSWRLALAHEPAAKSVTIAGRSVEIPGLPLITAPAFAHLATDLFEAVQGAIAQLPGESREALGIHGLVRANAADYEQLKHPPFGLVGLFP
jgi:ABC-type phosphate/phosphonate transport system substrate-binding protein